MLNKKPVVISIFFVIAFLIYFSSINSSFQFDDQNNIIGNTSVHIDKLSLEALKGAASSGTDAGSSLRPLAYISLALNYYFSGLDTTSYHVVNIIIHVLNAFFIYLIILALFDYDKADDEKKGKLTISAFFTALFWLVTPSNSQAVIYIVQRMTLMMTFFFLLSFWFYVKGRKLKRAKYFVFSGIFFLLSFLSKQNAITLPLVIILYELIFERGGDLKDISRNEKFILAVLVIFMLLPAILLWDNIHEMFKISPHKWDFSYYERELTQFRVLVFSLSLLILPLPNRLSVLHHIVKSTSLFSPITTFFSIILILGLFVVAILRIKKSPYFSFALLWFFITMSVELLVPIELFHEHRLYLPSIFLIGASVNYATERFYDKRQVLISALCSIIVLWGVLTGIRGKTWMTPLSLWSDTVSKVPEMTDISTNLDDTIDDANIHVGHEPFDISLAIAYNNLGNSYNDLGNLDRDLKMLELAEINYFKSIASKKDWDLPYFNLGSVYFVKGDYKKAAKSLRRAVYLSPKNEENYLKLALTYHTMREYDKAIEAYKEALKLNPNNPDTYNSIGSLYKNLEKYDLSERYLQDALSFHTYRDRFRFVYLELGFVYFQKKDYNKALEMYNKAFQYGIGESPNYADAFLVLGNVYVELGDLNSAVTNFNKGVAIGLKIGESYQNIGYLYNDLGTSYKSMKKFKEAVANFNLALKYLPNNKVIENNLKEIETLLNE
jgi:tetratricopeptide (TPR) repeat protein